MTFTQTLTLATSRVIGASRAILLVNPTGDDNSVLFTAKPAGAGGEAISVTYATPAEQAATAIGVTGNSITVTPATKARMTITGTSSANGIVLGDSIPDGGGRVGYNTSTTAAVQLYYNTSLGQWRIRTLDGTYQANKTAAAASPEGLTGWTILAGTGDPTITAGITSAEQVITEINASFLASPLVTASASGAATGAVASVAEAFLELPP